MALQQKRGDGAAPRKTKKTPAKQSGTPTPRESFEISALSQNDITILAETFRLLGDPSRLKILLRCLEGSSSVGEIVEAVDLSQSLVSHHLRLLRGARLVKGERHAKHIFYEVADSHVRQVLLDMAHHIAEEHSDD
ncbi:ArsR/SmtB family transcription factor [Pseudomonas monteilii]|jgi:DNA-binding transcriptional ArsR family regulator|uniref:ArsR/SmtB family transcription factor n=1 Tax=Pseudomonadota TaxID=1224 RepID=UPI001E2B049C|nr:metalloregulator ArsR/SmtB family transcription factor [Pseudomonas monteilii]MCE0872507.1 metalloregulator ArsR/SmtB family transcription factor [Pseudomonas monteilii]